MKMARSELQRSEFTTFLQVSLLCISLSLCVWGFVNHSIAKDTSQSSCKLKSSFFKTSAMRYKVCEFLFIYIDNVVEKDDCFQRVLTVLKI